MRKTEFIYYSSELYLAKSLPQFTVYVNLNGEYFPHIRHPSGLPCLPNLVRRSLMLTCQTLEVQKYGCVPSALHLRKTWQLQDLEFSILRTFVKQKTIFNLMEKKSNQDHPHIYIVTMGSAGDTYPFIALARSLSEKGFNCHLIANPYFENIIHDEPFEFIGLGTKENYLSMINDPLLWHPVKGFETTISYALSIAIDPIIKFFKTVDPKSTLVIGSTLSFGAMIACDLYKLNYITIHLQPSIFQSAYSPPLRRIGGEWSKKAPVWFINLTNYLLDRVFIKSIATDKLNKIRKLYNLNPINKLMMDGFHSSKLTIGLFPDWFGQMQPDWPKCTKLSNFVFFDHKGDHSQLDGNLEAFIQSKSSPLIVCTLGSAMLHGKPIYKTIQQLETASDLRFILIGNENNFSGINFSTNVFICSYAPFDNLFNNCDLIIHHGGIGTTAQALKAGIPQLILPFCHDQPDNAFRLKSLGCAVYLDYKKLTVEKLKKNIDRLLGESYYKNQALNLSKLILNESKNNNAVDIIQEYLRQ